jgi:hypothetical protein
MSELNCEQPRSNDAFLENSAIGAFGGVESGTLEKVRARIYQATPPADPPDPATDTHCREADADMTGTFWEINDLTNLLNGANQLGLWGYFTGAGWVRASPVPLNGFENPSGPPWGPAPHGPPEGPPGPPGGPVPHPPGRKAAMAAAGEVPAPAPMALPALPAQFKLRVNRWRLSRLAEVKQLLNGRALQAAPVILDYDFGLSGLTRMAWSTMSTTMLPEDQASTSKWILELPIPQTAGPGSLFAVLYLQQMVGAAVKIDHWASFVFDPTAEIRFLPHGDIPDVMMVSPGP